MYIYMPIVTNIDEIKERMKRVRNAKKPKTISSNTLLQVGNKENNEIQIDNNEVEEIPKDKFMLLLNIIMELQRDIDYLIEAHKKAKN